MHSVCVNPNMLTQERTIMDIENEITKRVESDLKDSKLPAEDRKGVGGMEGEHTGNRLGAMCQNQQLRSIQLNHCFAPKLAQQSPAVSGGSLNFSTSSEDLDHAFVKKPKTIRDPMSHRIIEKRRRDRMNNCLADLSRLIPTNYLKQGQGRIEKTEIIEMAIKLIKDLTSSIGQPHGLQSSLPDRYLGFKECQDEVMRYLVEVEGWDAMDELCNRLMSHLEQAGEKFRIMNDESLSKVAKEEQYRHADEEMGSCHEVKNPFIMKAGAPPPHYPPPQIAPYPTPMDPQAMMNSSVATSPQENTPMDTQTNYTNFNTFASAQQITQEHLKRDKHLWTLLQQTKYNSATVDDSGVSTDPGSGSSNVTEGDKFSEQTPGNSFKSLLDTSSPNSSSCGTMDSSSEKNSISVYKFKHNITKRFSQEEKKVNRSDTSSSSSREDKRAEKGKRKLRHVRSRSPSSSHYKNMESLTVGNGSNEECNSVNVEDVKLSSYLPAFLLHPSGTHYIPISIHPSSINTDVFSKNGRTQNIYHPISIPVNFGGPLLYMEKFSIHSSDSSTSFGSSSTTDSPSGCSVENSSSCNSENSPSPEHDRFKTQT